MDQEKIDEIDARRKVTSTTLRSISPELEAIMFMPLEVLDKGFIRVTDYVGCDASVVAAARVSYGKGTKTPSDDRTLIRYLLRQQHTTPLEQCRIQLHVRVPMDTWRQWIRHRMSSTNEYSTRYSVAINDKQETLDYQWRSQSKKNKQGSGSFLNAEGVGFDLSQQEHQLHQLAEKIYKDRIAAGVAREQARKDLPLSTYTEAYWSIDLHNLLHFLSLRMHPHAQLEIRSYANVIGQQIVAKWVPAVWEAFTDYRLEAHTFSRQEMQIIRSLLSKASINVSHIKGLIPNKRERDEFYAKLGE